MQRTYSLHLRSTEGVEQGSGSPASPGSTMWPPSSPLPAQRSISVLLDQHINSGTLGPDSRSEDDRHEHSKPYGGRLKVEQSVHLIPLVLFLCALILWLGTQSD